MNVRRSTGSTKPGSQARRVRRLANARSTSPGASIRLCAPETNELYDFAAAYLLAPRTVARTIEGDFTAGYACPEKLPPGTALGKGTLVRR